MYSGAPYVIGHNFLYKLQYEMLILSKRRHSSDKDNGISTTPYLLALMIWQIRMEGCHNTNWVGGDPTIHLHTIVEAIGMLDSLQMSAINKMKQYEYIESIKADNYINRYNTTLKNSESAFYQRRLFNSPRSGTQTSL